MSRTALKRISFFSGSLHSFVQLAVVALVSAVLAGCASNNSTTMLAPARPAIINAAAVRVYERPPKRFQEIAIIQAKTLGELRSKAAALGANGILPSGVVPHSGPLIGIGLGTSSYSIGRRSAVGVGTSASFAIPTGSSVIEATAIHVP